MWRGPELQGRDDWKHPLPEEVIAEMDVIAARVRKTGLEVDSADASGLDTPALDAFLAPMPERLSHRGAGLALITGVPVERYSHRELEVIL